MARDDPDFEKKAAEIMALYVDTPQHAAVFWVEENRPFRRRIDWTQF